MDKESLPMIDSHIHLYAAAHLPRLNWTGSLPADHILNRQSSVDEYKPATKQAPSLLGFVFLETDRRSSLDEDGWKDPLEEVEFLARIARGEPLAGEGHSQHDGKLVLGIVPWAPVPAGMSALARYTSLVKSACRDERTYSLIKGFRYLLQDKPRRTMLQPDFVAGLEWLGQNEFTFDLGVDSRSGGIWQLQEACRMLERLSRDKSELIVVINHLCKPNLHLANADGHSDFTEWARCIKTLAKYPSAYMKLSGFFSELLEQHEQEPTPVPELVERVKPWVQVVLSAFGPSRIMFGSDWPVCAAGGPGSKAWSHWHDLVAALLDDLQLSEEDKREIWSGTAVRAYNISLPEV